jgi:hypothetical protein
MDVIYLLLFVVGAVCFGLAAFGVVVSRVNLMALGLLMWILVPLLEAIQSVD